MKRKRTYRAKKTVQNDVAPETSKPPRKSVFDENITSMETETPTSGTVVRGNHRNLEIERNDNGRMEINTNTLSHMIATIIKEISKEAGGMANLSRNLVGNSINNGQMGHSHVNMELQENESRLHHNPEYKKPELNASLAVIKKIMKLDAADPFNRPVDPVALGIPDYFDVIDTPMDFASICNNIENGFKYLNSADVFKDVQYIWHNCVRYNKKGDHILELMKRVKIHFMKYWIAAGLDTEHANVGFSNLDGGVVNPSSIAPLRKTFLLPTESSILSHNKEQKDYPLTPLANNFTQLQQREPGSNQIAENRPGPSNMQAGQPQQSSSQPESSPERDETNIATPDSTITQKKVRGPTRGAKLLSTGGRIAIVTNELGQPVGPEATKLTIFLGLTARDGNLAPLTYPSWSKMPKENKENMWQKVLTKFDIDPSCQKWVLMSLRSKWRNFKFYLKASHYDPHTTDEERLADCDDRVLLDQWSFLVSQWSSEEWQSLSARNKAKRAMVKFNHTSGTKSFARVLEEERAKRPDGQEPSRAELFILTRTHKNGQPVNEATAAVISQLRESTNQDDLSVFGLNAISSLPGTVIPTRSEALMMVKEKNAEVVEMKERLAAVEQTCSQMAAQMSAMVSMMANMHKASPAENLPNAGAGTLVPVGMPPNQVEPTSTSNHEVCAKKTRGRKKRR